ncbi:MFS transporter [Paenibacillus yanchengensis]|uniref:MFS transporter n=1 Tax=Paenibacillus yanchengensis TaxID=2035833 RepID=A0ABW4YQG1_9BACL
MEQQQRKASIFSPQYRASTIGIILAVTTVAFEGLAITTIAPEIARQLSGIQLYGWIFSSFLLTQLLGTIIIGQQINKIGVNNAYIVSHTLFITGIIIAALANSMGVLVIARAFQGFGAGAIMTCAYYSISLNYPNQLRTKILAAFSSAYILPSLIGPYFAGVLAEQFTWRLVFWFVLPLIAIALVLTVPTFLKLQRKAFAEREQHTNDRTKPSYRTELQAVLLTFGTALLLLGLGKIVEWQGIVLTIIGLLILIKPLQQLLPPGSLKLKRGMPSIIVSRGLYMASYIAAESYVVLALTELKGNSADTVGLVVAGGSITWSFAAWLQSKLDERAEGKNRERRISIGLVCMTIGLASIVTVVNLPGNGLFLTLISQMIIGFGIGLANPTTGAIALSKAPKGAEGEVSAHLQFIDAFGPGLSIGIGGAIIAVSNFYDAGLSTGIIIALALQLTLAIISLIISFRVKN